MISNLFSIANGSEIVVKYKDDENDLVTISSDEELAFAVNLFPTDILRIVVELAIHQQKSSSPDCQNQWHKKERCSFVNDEKRGHFLHAKRERVLAGLKELEGNNFQENPKLLWKQEQLQRKLQNLDAKIAHFSSGGPNHSFGRGHPGCAQSEDRRCQFLAMKKEKIVARLKELEGTDFQANPGL